MSNLRYSNEALNVRAKFSGVDVMVYVEGRDDVPFWEEVFRTICTLDVGVESVGGSPELDKLVDGVVSGDLQAFIARDSDYSSLDGSQFNHSRVLYTYGHSIENSLISKNSILACIRSIGRLSIRDVSEKDCETWLANFHKTIEDILSLDICLHRQNASKGVLSANCEKFMVKKGSPELSGSKIEAVKQTENFVSFSREISSLKTTLIGQSRTLADFLRGHFLFSVVLRYVNSSIKTLGSKTKSTNNDLFGALLMDFSKTFDKSHDHYAHYHSSIVAAESSMYKKRRRN